MDVRWTGGRRRTGIVVALTAAAPPATEAGAEAGGPTDPTARRNPLTLAGGRTARSAMDLRRYRSVVVWCRRFTYAFGAAPLR
jgi:electron transfer DM13